jgi:hypothetical protein
MQKPKESKHLEDNNQKRKSSKSIVSNNAMVISQKANSHISDILHSKMLIDIQKPNILEMKFYLERENEVLIQHYGPEIYDFSKDLENVTIPADYLKRHKIDPCTRAKMIDWMIEVLYAYCSDPPTFYLAVHIFDQFIYKSKATLSNNDVHLMGIVSLYIASKMEDVVPLRMSHVKTKIGHNKFSESQIKNREKSMLETINFDIITSSTYDFIKTFIFDFCHNNKEFINKLNLHWVIDMFDTTAIYLSKLIAHSEEFTQYK